MSFPLVLVEFEMATVTSYFASFSLVLVQFLQLAGVLPKKPKRS